jgi:hypothetical protein
MNKKQWEFIYGCYFLISMVVVAVCITTGWRKTAWLIVLPLALVIGAILRRKKNPN